MIKKDVSYSWKDPIIVSFDDDDFIVFAIYQIVIFVPIDHMIPQITEQNINYVYDIPYNMDVEHAVRIVSRIGNDSTAVLIEQFVSRRTTRVSLISHLSWCIAGLPQTMMEPIFETT